MPSKQKSIFRRPEAQHFQLVHRSQRDPLIHDPDAAPHILKPIKRENDIKKGKTRAELESYLPNLDKERENIGEAAEHGIYFDDTDYDYMQHLRDPNMKEEGMETILLPSSTSGSKNQGTKSRSDPFELKIPLDVLPPTLELNSSKALDAQRNIQDDIAGFKPDMDPHLRQVLEALGEDAFVDDSLEDDFFGELVKQGERGEGDGVDFEFYEDGEEAQNDFEDYEDEVEGEESWEARFIKFKKEQQRQKTSGVDEDEDEGSSAPDIDTRSQAETVDTVGKLPVIGGKRRRRGAATASSGFSMTSSAVYRNDGLTLLDQRFEQFDKTYDDDDMPSDPEDLIDSDPDEAPDLIAAREDFEAVMDDFLENYELVGRRMRPTLKGDTGIDKLDTIRRALGTVSIKDEEDYIEEDKKILMPIDVDEEKERWDCETILSTYSNLENHPRLIRARDTKSTPKIKLDPKSGLPIVTPAASIPTQNGSLLKDLEERDEESQDSDSTDRPSRVTITRPKDESKEEKKARKMVIKQERQARRQDKKAKQELFSNERKQLVKTISQKADVKMKRL